MPVARIASCGEECIQVLAGKDDEGKCGNGKSGLSYQIGQFGELYVQRGLLLTFFRSLTGHFTYFRSVAHAFHFHDSMSVGNGCAAHCGIRRVGSLFIEVGFVCRLVHHQFAGQGRFVDLQRNGFQQDTVGR